MCSNLFDHINVDKVCETCFNFYNKLPKTGKPTKDEWTVLSCILAYDKTVNKMEIISLATGTKCIGASEMSSKGDKLNDSHAEVMARRGLLLYLYENIHKVLLNKPSVLYYENSQFKLKNNIELIFYASQLPCGDAAIVDKNESQVKVALLPNKHKIEDTSHIAPKKPKLQDDIHRTGAKCLPEAIQDPKEPGAKYHICGQVRTKPGRGETTLSVSCTDKLAKWIHLGIQGSLLSLLIEPIVIKHFIFGGGTPFSEESLYRAFFDRNNLEIKPNLIEIKQTQLVFECLKSETRQRACPTGLLWIGLDKPIKEVAVRGKKLGVTKKTANLMSSALCICKYNIYKQFINTYKKYIELNDKISNEMDFELPYTEMKKKSIKYYENWEKHKDKFFKSWTVKPDIWNFCIK